MACLKKISPAFFLGVCSIDLSTDRHVTSAFTVKQCVSPDFIRFGHTHKTILVLHT